MNKEEWLTLLQQNKDESAVSLSFLPLGWDEEGKTVFSHRKNRQDRYCHTCVTGSNRTFFIMDMVATLAKIYGQGAAFFVLSPRREYARLLAVKGADITVPYIRTEKDYLKMLDLVKAQVQARKQNARLPKYFVVLDGLDECDFLPKDNAFTYVRKLIEDLSGGAEIISGIQFRGSIFEGFEGAFVGVGNSLISTDEKGKADVVYVGDGCELDCPKPIEYATYFGA